MRLALPILMLLAVPVMAQQPSPPPAIQAYQTIAHQAIEREANALAEVVNQRQQIEAMKTQIDNLMKSAKTPPATIVPAPTDSK